MPWWRKREVWFGALSVVLMGVVYNQLSAWLIPSMPPDLLAPTPAGKQARGLAAEAVPEVRLQALASRRTVYDPRGRNLFQYGQRPAPEPPPPPPVDLEQLQRQRQAEEEEQRRRVEEILRQKAEAEAQRHAQAQAAQPPPTAAPAAPAPPPVDYKFVGYLGKPQEKIAVLLHDNEVVLAREGERLGKEFFVRRIRFEAVELGYTDPKFKEQKQLLPMGN